MKLKDYIKDKLLVIISLFLSLIIIISILTIFNLNKYLITIIITILLITYIFIFIYEYSRRKYYYNELNKILNNLDQKYLINEIIKEPNFLEGKIFYDALYTINKTMIEEINKYKFTNEEFREYLELWCHEIKTPVATSQLIIENNSNNVTKNIEEEINKIDYYIEQVLYYARMENANKDYIISNVNLKETINEVIKKNKKDIINKNIKIEINNIDYAYTDTKWIEFIINQIIINSIKYSKETDAKITIDMTLNKNNKILYIKDNGIGIPNEEIEKVFIKGFTGSNGRKKYNSTGIGLYLCKKLCNKLGHNIFIKSTLNERTIVSIIFPNNSLTEKIK